MKKGLIVGVCFLFLGVLFFMNFSLVNAEGLKDSEHQVGEYKLAVFLVDFSDSSPHPFTSSEAYDFTKNNHMASLILLEMFLDG